jgi:hypothetical protein
LASTAHTVEIQNPPDIYCKALGGTNQAPSYIRINLEAGTVEWFKPETYKKGGKGWVHRLVGYEIVPEWTGKKNQLFIIKFGEEPKYHQAGWGLLMPRDYVEWNDGQIADGMLNNLDPYGKPSGTSYACNLVQ